MSSMSNRDKNNGRNDKLPASPLHEEEDYFPSDFSRRNTLDIMAAGGLMAALGPLMGGLASPALAADDEVVRIGYLPITDATALLVAHAMGYFKDEGLEAAK